MHCPKCGQMQASVEVRFCTRCGLAMGNVKELVVPELAERKNKNRNKRERGIRQGLSLMLFGLVLVSVLAVLHDLNLVSQIFVKLAAIVFCIGGAVRMGWSVISNENDRLKKKGQVEAPEVMRQPLVTTRFTGKALPQANIQPATDFNILSYRTTELIEPASVTEHTTKSLKERQQQSFEEI